MSLPHRSRTLIKKAIYKESIQLALKIDVEVSLLKHLGEGIAIKYYVWPSISPNLA